MEIGVSATPAATSHESRMGMEVGEGIGISNWKDQSKIIKSFLSYMKGPQQGISNERTLASYATGLLSFICWLRRDRADDEEQTTFPLRLVAPTKAAEYIKTQAKTKAAEESFCSLHCFICQWVNSGNTTKFLENSDATKRVQQRKRQKRQATARRMSDQSPIELTQAAVDKLRRRTMVAMDAEFNQVIMRLLRGQTTFSDRVYMATCVPTAIVCDGRPVRACDLMSLSSAQGEELASGEAIVIEEQKDSCKHRFAYIPNTPNITRCVSAYNTLFRPHLTSLNHTASAVDI